MQNRKAKMFFEVARKYMSDNYPKELKEIKEIKPFKSIRSNEFLWEYCWVVYASGFRESILEQKVGDIEKAFRYFDIKKSLI